MAAMNGILAIYCKNTIHNRDQSAVRIYSYNILLQTDCSHEQKLSKTNNKLFIIIITLSISLFNYGIIMDCNNSL
jgi:hypothetical protein